MIKYIKEFFVEYIFDESTLVVLAGMCVGAAITLIILILLGEIR